MCKLLFLCFGSLQFVSVESVSGKLFSREKRSGVLFWWLLQSAGGLFFYKKLLFLGVVVRGINKPGAQSEDSSVSTSFEDSLSRNSR